MTNNGLKMYDLLPALHRIRDAEIGFPLKALIEIIEEQAQVVQEDIEQLYEDSFVETCRDWVVPYLGDLIGYPLSAEAATLGEPSTDRDGERGRLLIPRRDVANTIRHRQRRGTLALLEELASAVAGWRSRAVEMGPLVGGTLSLNGPRADRGRSIGLRDLGLLKLLGTPFSTIAHTLDVRRINPHGPSGRYGLGKVALFVWRNYVWSIVRGQAVRTRRRKGQQGLFRFDPLNRSLPLFTLPVPETDPTSIASEVNLPVPIKRWMLAENLAAYYGRDKSFMIWRSSQRAKNPRDDDQDGNAPDPMRPYQMQPVPLEQIEVRDLSEFSPRHKQVEEEAAAVGEGQDRRRSEHDQDRVAVDPENGLIAFPRSNVPERVEVTFQTSFGSRIGGGGYTRKLLNLPDHTLRAVRTQKEFNEALAGFLSDGNASDVEALQRGCREVVVEIWNSGTYQLPQGLSIPDDYSLQIRSARGHRPVLVSRIPKWQKRRRGLVVGFNPGSRLTLDGLAVEGIYAEPQGGDTAPNGGIDAAPMLQAARPVLTLRHCTILSPGKVDLVSFSGDVRISKCIVGPIDIRKEQAQSEPLLLTVEDSVLDPRTPESRKPKKHEPCQESLKARRNEDDEAHVVAVFRRSTVIGAVRVESITLAEDCLFLNEVEVDNPTVGCLRFCYIEPRPDNRLPPRYQCQPETALAALGPAASAIAKEALRRYLKPRLRSLRVESPRYCQLSLVAAAEILRGGTNGSEMGVFHDEFRPQREALLRTRLEEHVPAETMAEVIIAD